MILQINFTVNAPLADYEKVCDSLAQTFAELPGLKWKIWLLNPATKEAGGIYLFDSQESLDAYLAGPIVAQLKVNPALSNLSAKQFQVMPNVTAITRGPAGGPSAAAA